MLDFILGLLLAGLLVRGWLRGFVREVLDLLGLVAGLWIAIALSPPLGDFVTKRFGVTPEIARIGAGVALFVTFGIAMSIAAHYLSRVMRLPGLNLVNRVGGSVVAIGWGAALLLLLVSLADVAPLPDAWEKEVESSVVIGLVAGQDSLPARMFDSLLGDSVLGALGSIQDIFGANRAVPEGDERLTFPSARPDEVRQVRDEAATIVSEVNEFRAGLGLRPVHSSDAIIEAAEDRAVEMYTSGVLARVPDCAGKLGEHGARVTECGQAIALAGSALGALEGILDSETGRSELANSSYDRVGVAVVDGPTGRLLMIFVAR